jgi:hypothetical protein
MILVVMVTSALILIAGCAVNMASEIDLPDAEAVQYIAMNQYNELSLAGGAMITDRNEMNRVLSSLSGAVETAKTSVNDSPAVDEYLIIRFRLENETRTMFLYTMDGADYLEEPYVGIYRMKHGLDDLYSIYTLGLEGMAIENEYSSVSSGGSNLVRPLPEQPQYEVGNVTVISNGREYEPYEHYYHSQALTERGMVSTETLPLSFEDASSILPEIQYTDDFSVVVTGKDATRVMYSLYDNKFNILYDREDDFAPPAGTGVYMLCVYVIWSNSEIEQQNRESRGLQYVFKVSV